MAGQVVFGLIAGSQTTSSLNSFLDEDTSTASFHVPDEHAVQIEVAETKDVVSCHRDPKHSEGSREIRVDSKTLIAEAGRQVECRICREEEDIEQLETPCACSGSMKYAHRICIQRWCYVKGDTVCEICQEQYVNGYGTFARASHAEMTPRPLDDQNEIDYPHPRTMGAPEVYFQHPDFDSESEKHALKFLLGSYFLLLLMAFKFYLQGGNVPGLSLAIAFVGGGCWCCLRYILITSARGFIHERQLHQIAVRAGIYRRRRLRHRRAQFEVAMDTAVAQSAPNLHLATDLHEHRIMIPAEFERIREQGE